MDGAAVLRLNVPAAAMERTPPVNDTADRAAELLAAARRDRRPLDSLPDDLRPVDADSAYAVQERCVAALGGGAIGWKVGATNAAAQAALNWPEPFYGRILASTAHESPAEIGSAGLFRRGLEVEFAFRLARDLPASGAPWSRESVADAVGAVHPAIEIVDSRFAAGLGAGGLALIADNGAHGAFVHGPGTDDWRGLDFAGMRTELRLNGEKASEGSGANVMGHPLAPLVWLANARAACGEGLAAGELVTTGSTCAAIVFADPGDSAEARFADLGAVSVSFR